MKAAKGYSRFVAFAPFESFVFQSFCDDREMYQRLIDATDAQIDALVYALYGLTEEEIKIVEG